MSRQARYEKGYQRGRDMASLTIARAFADSDKPRWWRTLRVFVPNLIRFYRMLGWYGLGYVRGMSDGVRLAVESGGE